MLPARRFHDNWIPDVFNDFFDNNWLERTHSTTPAVNVLENEKSYDVEVAAPGMTKDDFKVSLDENGDLVINLDKKRENEEKNNGHYIRREFSFEKFQQTLILPDDVDREKIGAKVENGILKVNLPKPTIVKPEDKHKKIEIQ